MSEASHGGVEGSLPVLRNPRLSTEFPNPKSCTHIKVNGVRCESPALRGEQFCYFHQHAHRGVRRPARSRLHPMALIESEEAIQASLMEVINGLLRNTLDTKRAELILRALRRAAREAAGKEVNRRIADRDASTAPRPSLRSDAAPLSMTGERETAARVSIAAPTAKAGQDTGQAAFPRRLVQPSEGLKAGSSTGDPTKRKPPVGVKAQTTTARTKNIAAPKERKNAAQRASAG